jgi:hypothetical protein
VFFRDSSDGGNVHLFSYHSENQQTLHIKQCNSKNVIQRIHKQNYSFFKRIHQLHDMWQSPQ